MPNRNSLNRLIAELEIDIHTLKELERKNSKAMQRINAGAKDELDWAALGYTLHNLYNGIENYCLRIAKFFENEISGDSWHKDLLFRMTLEIKDLRPALLDQASAEKLHELRGFRHVFRNIYQSRLDEEKVMLVQKRLPEALKAFYSAHEEYLKKMETLAEQLDD
jgi:hypothetical protein